MAMAVATQISFVILFFFGFLLSGLYSETLLMITNKCSYIVWPAISSSSWPLSTTGFTLKPGESNTVPVPDSWSGRLWGRTLCSHNVTTGNFSCVTGDCDSSIVECGGHNGAPPFTLVEFTLNATDGVDYFDVSLVNGFNLPVRVEPRSRRRIGAGICTATSCEEDLNQKCPAELKITKDGEGVVGCRSSLFSEFFKSECPQAHVYAYDDHASSFTSCASADYYSITFCRKSSKSTGNGEIDMSEAA